MTKYVDAFISDQRRRLDHLERFVQTPEYQRLLVVAKGVDAEAEVWLAEWLIRPAFGLAAPPIDVAFEPGGVDRLAGHISQILSNTGA